LFEGKHPKLVIGSHDEALNEPNNFFIDKKKIPSNLRKLFLQKLDEMNINAHSLMGTEDALMETLANRTMFFKNQP
jgi:hypothetical protein